MHHDDPRCEARGEIEIVQRHQHGKLILVGQFVDQFQQSNLVLQIEMCRGLVKQQDGR